MQSSREEILFAAHQEYLSLLEQCRKLDRFILKQVPNWQEHDHMAALLAKCSIDIALLMLGADHEYTSIECQAFNAIFGLNEKVEDLIELAQNLQERDISEQELFDKLDRLVLAVTLSRPLVTVAFLDQLMSFFDSVAQIMALIDEAYHPQENAFYQRVCQRLRVDLNLSERETLLLKLTDGLTFSWPPKRFDENENTAAMSFISSAMAPIDLALLKAARERYLELLNLYQTLDDYILLSVSNWLPSDHFCAQLSALCEDTALAMLGADKTVSETELWAFNTIFALHESHHDLEMMSQWINQKQVKEDELFTRLDRFMLNSSLIDHRMGTERTALALAYFQALGQLIALVDQQYELHEDMFFRELLERIEHSWRDVSEFVKESEPAIMLNLSNGATQLFYLH